MTTDSTSAPEPMPAWAGKVIEHLDGIESSLMDIHEVLKNINAQLATIGEVDRWGSPDTDPSENT
ncbi:UNVERIFIED_ORG: hypothetical protein E4P37_07915 [Bacillus sp. AZ43]